jgi:hypothetical protein
MALPLATTGSLSPAFASARLVGLAVKHPIYLCALRMIADHAEGTFELLRYNLGGNRPSQTDPLTLSPDRIHGHGLDGRLIKTGISLMAPPLLTK